MNSNIEFHIRFQMIAITDVPMDSGSDRMGSLPSNVSMVVEQMMAMPS